MANRNVQLTDEIVGSGSRRKAGVTAALALAMVLLANLAARWALSEHTPNMGYWLIHKKWTMVQSMKSPVDWLMLGDSSCNQGVRPDVWSRAGLGSAINLCTIGNMLAVNDAWMLETYLATHPPPKAVVLVHVYDTWYRDAGTLRNRLLGKVPLSYGFWERLNPRLELSGRQALNFALTRYLPLYTENKSIARWIWSPDRFASEKYSVDEHGYMAWHEADKAQVRSDLAAHRRFLNGRDFVLSRENRDALIRIRKLADERGFDVYIANGPVYEELRREPAFRSYLTKLNREMTDYVGSNSRLHFILKDPPTFQADQMVNCDHLVDGAARMYTERLAAAVRAAQSP
jgi:hypothetical protein